MAWTYRLGGSRLSLLQGPKTAFPSQQHCLHISVRRQARPALSSERPQSSTLMLRTQSALTGLPETEGYDEVGEAARDGET